MTDKKLKAKLNRTKGYGCTERVARNLLLLNIKTKLESHYILGLTKLRRSDLKQTTGKAAHKTGCKYKLLFKLS